MNNQKNQLYPDYPALLLEIESTSSFTSQAPCYSLKDLQSRSLLCGKSLFFYCAQLIILVLSVHQSHKEKRAESSIFW